MDKKEGGKSRRHEASLGTASGVSGDSVLGTHFLPPEFPSSHQIVYSTVPNTPGFPPSLNELTTHVP